VGATGGLTESLAARIDGIWMQRDGFLDDVIGGGDYNDRNRYMVRGQLLYQPNDDLSVRLIADYAKRNEQCCAAVYQPTRDFRGGLSLPSTIAFIERGLGGTILDDPYDRKIALTPGRSYNSDVQDYGVSLEGTYDFGAAELTSITAYRFNDYERGQDADFNDLDILFRDGSGGSANTFKTFTQELRLQGELWGGRLDWLVGGYFAHENLKVKDNLAYGSDYERFANCLVANSFAGSFINTGHPVLGPLGAALIDPSNPTCFNTAAATALARRHLQHLLASVPSRARASPIAASGTSPAALPRRASPA
jgi:hypothetical protein